MTDHAHIGRVLAVITAAVFTMMAANAAIEWVAANPTATSIGACILTSSLLSFGLWAFYNVGRRP